MIKELHRQLVRREISSYELTQKYISLQNETENIYNAYITKTQKYALELAIRADKMLKSGDGGPLCGIPMSLKDNISTAGIKTTCASKMLEDYIPIFDATVWLKLRECGAVLLGKTNMSEFSMGSNTSTSYFKESKNPHNINHTSGGSSGGAATSVGIGTSVYSIGSDTGGSVRQPAAFCGVVGLKPTYSAISRYGLISFASSLDTIGIITGSVEDCAVVFDELNMNDSLDATSSRIKRDKISDKLICDIKKIKIGFCKDILRLADEDMKNCLISAADNFRLLGAQIVDIELDFIKYALPAYYIISSCEASSNLARYDGLRYGYNTDTVLPFDEKTTKNRSEAFDKEVRRRIMLGTYALSSGYYDDYYKKAKNIQAYVKVKMEDVFNACDAVIMPTAPGIAPKIDCATSDDPTKIYKSDIFTVPANITGNPSVSIPCGKKDGLPLGLQIIGKHFDEKTILSLALAYEKIGAKEWLKNDV